MKNVKIYIDTTSNEIIRVGVIIDGKKDIRSASHETKKAQIVLPLIATLLTEHHVTIKDIRAIDVMTGPGSFTGVRVGVAIANTLGYMLGIPINGKECGVLAEPIYESSIYDTTS